MLKTRDNNHLTVAIVLFALIAMIHPIQGLAVGPIDPEPGPGGGGNQPVFQNPLGGNDQTFIEILGTIIQWLIGFSASLALLAIVTGGIMYIISFGDENRTRRAKSILFWAVIGLIVTLMAFTIIITVTNSILGVPLP